MAVHVTELGTTPGRATVGAIVATRPPLSTEHVRLSYTKYVVAPPPFRCTPVIFAHAWTFPST